MAPLHYAANRGDLDTVKSILQADPTLMRVRSSGWGCTALIIAAQGGYIDIVTWLMDHHGVSVMDAQDYDQQTALYSAITFDHPSIACLLIDRGVNINLANKEGTTPLMTAVRNGYDDVINKLMEKKEKLEIDAQDLHGNTALHLAMYRNRVDIAKLLLQSGADPRIADHHGGTCLGIAKFRRMDECITLLEVRD